MAIQKIMVAFDDSELAEAALAVALDLAKGREGATVDVVYVTALPSTAFVNVPDAASMLDVIASHSDRAFVHAKELVENADVPCEVSLLSGTSAAALLLKHAAETEADLIVMGSRGKRGFTEQFGSVSHAVLHGAKVPVLITK